MKEAYKLFHEGVLHFTEMQYDGICINTQLLESSLSEAKTKFAHLEKEVQGLEWLQNVDYTSNIKLAMAIIRAFRINLPTTEKGNYRVDKHTLSKLKKVKGIDSLLALGKHKKIIDVLELLKKETTDGFCHPSINLHMVRSYRSSSSDPNFQNMPIRDPQQGKIIRSCIIPRSPNNHIIEIDYSGLEVYIAYCHHKDPVMKEYLENPATDMHRDNACGLFFLQPQAVTKAIRFHAKSGFTFPAFYGSYYEKMAPALWESIQELELVQHMKSKNINHLRDFKKHVKAFENIFWNTKFKVYTAWKKQNWERYQQALEIHYKTGFQCRGVLRRNQVNNFPIQGSGFHVNLWSVITLRKELKRHRMGAKVIGQIHDSILADVPTDEKDDYIALAKDITQVRTRQRFPWINIDLKVDVDYAPMGKSWYEKGE